MDFFKEIVADSFTWNVPRCQPWGGDWLPRESKCLQSMKSKANKAAKNFKVACRTEISMTASASAFVRISFRQDPSTSRVGYPSVKRFENRVASPNEAK